jgi:uncharacterized protein with FMN-binding domain
MKKLFLSVFVISAFVFYVILSNKSGKAVASLPVTTSSNVTTSAQYKDGQYTGSSFDAYYGNIQVKAIIKNGKITDVQFLQFPSDRNESVEINSRSMPQLTQEAIQAQSATVDIVSGATDSSQAFIQSLTSALSQAKS